jgi:hypothetical protein
MKILKKSFASGVRSFQGTLIAILLAGPVVQGEAVLYTTSSVSSGVTYSATYDDSQNGFTDWSANGANQLALQSLYYSVNSGPVTLLTPSSASATTFLSSKITVNYAIPGAGNVVDTMTLNGSSLLQSIKFTSSTAVNISLFQYSDFILGGPGYAGSQTVGLTPAATVGGFATASQNGGGLALTWSGHAAGSTALVQANGSGVPFGAFIGSGTDLDNTTLTANNTHAVFGFEFSGSVAQGNSLTISETSAFPVPEPSSMALISSGILAVALVFRRRRSKKV